MFIALWSEGQGRRLWSGEPAIDISERNRGMCVRERLDQARRPEGKQAIMASFRELGTMPENVGNERCKE